MKAIIGSAGVPLTTDVISTIVGLIAMDQDAIAVRGPMAAGQASPIEDLVYSLGTRTGRTMRVFRPSNGTLRPVPARDANLVGECDRIYAFFEKGHVMEGGTGNVVKLAMRYGRPVQAWEVDPLGTIYYAGSFDEEYVYG